jgi:adenylate kinase family enzyme
MLSDHLQAPVITPGDIYRRLREEQSELGVLVREALQDGGLAPCDLTNKIMAEEIARVGGRAIYDGYPRSTEQLDGLLENCEVGAYVHFEAPYDALIKAMELRRQCTECGVVMSVHYNGGWCEHVALADDSRSPKPWKQRWDDTAEFFPKRYETYLSVTEPILQRVRGLANYGKFQVIGREHVGHEIRDFLASVGVV